MAFPLKAQEPTIFGMRVIVDAHLKQDGEPYAVRRTWRERLLTRPWRPLTTTRVVTPRIPYQGFYQLGNRALLMHPAMLAKLRDHFKDDA